jgi:uncharacterized protein (DUF433 family)
VWLHCRGRVWIEGKRETVDLLLERRQSASLERERVFYLYVTPIQVSLFI